MLTKFSRRFFASTKQVGIEKLTGELSGITLFQINKPDTRNALSKILIDDLQEAIETTKLDESSRVVILRSAIPGMFCAGADLKERLKMTNSEVENFVILLRETFNNLYHLPQPVLACIDGPTLGGGLELALSCDLRIASKSSLLGLPETGLAIIPGAGGTQKLSRIIGISKAKELIYTGRRLTADEALALGILDYVEENYEKVYERGITIAKQILSKGPIAIRCAKEALNKSIETDLRTGLDFERLVYAKILNTEDRIEGVKSFLEKRKPVYKGK